MAPRRVIVEADGGSRGNPGPAGFGALLRDADTGEVIADVAEYIGEASNNVAEYSGLIAGLELYREHTPDAELEVRMDSKLVVEQMAGNWKIKHANLRPLALRAQRLAPRNVAWTWVPREQNKDADRLANLAMDTAMGRPTARTVSADPTPDDEEPPSAATATRNPMLGWSGRLGVATTLVFVRHGETVHTAERRFSGPGGDDPGLTEVGRDQAQRAGAALAADGEFAGVVASPLRRTRETASAVGDALGLPVAVDERFREAAFGDWDGLTLDEVEARWPVDLDAWLRSFDVAPPGGEAIVDVQERVEEGLRALLDAYPGQKIAVVSHVNPIKLAVRYCLGVGIDVVNKMLLAPGSLTTMSFYDSGASSLRQFSAVP